jgi:hypothetical protein
MPADQEVKLEEAGWPEPTVFVLSTPCVLVEDNVPTAKTLTANAVGPLTRDCFVNEPERELI